MGYNYIDKKFNRLKVIRATNKRHYGEIIWECLCDCGNLTQVNTVSLRTNKKKSCGCLKNEYLKSSKVRGNFGLSKIYQEYKSSAKNRNLIFELTKNELHELVIKNCFFCGNVANNVRKNYKAIGEAAKKQGTFYFNGIDRLDSYIGYTKKNTVSCCSTCNYAKHQLTVDEFKNWIIKIYNHFIKEFKD